MAAEGQTCALLSSTCSARRPLVTTKVRDTGIALPNSLRRGQVEAEVINLLPNGNGHGKSLTPMGGDAGSACNSTATRHKLPPTGVHAGDTLTDVIRGAQSWGDYAQAIARWEAVLGPAPDPTELGAKGNPRLAAPFPEWMMGLEPGHVTEVPGISRTEALKAIGNGVVPQQAAEALRRIIAAAQGL